MAPLRIIDPQGLYHVMSRGNFRQRMYPDDRHFAKRLALLRRVAVRRRWRILDWCLMPNHDHLVIQLTDSGLSEGMRELNGCFSRWSNLQTGRTGTGHLIQNRFRSIDVLEEGHFWSISRYVPLNPVMAGLVEQPDDWRWSGFRATIGLEHPYMFHQPAELLRYFGSTPTLAVDRYSQFVWEGLDRIGDAPWSDHDGVSRGPDPRG